MGGHATMAGVSPTALTRPYSGDTVVSSEDDMTTPPRRKQSAFRLSDDGLALLKLIALQLGLNMTGALEIIIREAAEKRSIKLDGRQSS